MEIVPGIHQLKVPIPDNPLGYLNSYLVQDEKGCLLVDTGWNSEGAFDSLVEQLREAGVTLQEISLVILTHVHPDHCGLAGRIKEACSARFAFHLWEQAFLESRYGEFAEIRTLQSKMGQFFRKHGVPDEKRPPMQRASLPVLNFVTMVYPDEVLYGGETFAFGKYEFEVLWTPGHSPGHVCLYEPTKKLLLAGDHILAVTTPNVSYHLQSGSNPLGDFLHSLRQVKRLPINLTLPAHEDVIRDVRARIDEIELHHVERNDAILAIIDDRPLTAYEVAGQVRWNVPDTNWASMSPWIKRAAVMETIAHLEWLRMEGEVERLSDGDQLRYSPY